MKRNILVTDVVKELSVEKKILSKYNLILKSPNELNNQIFSEIHGIITGHEINFNKLLLSKFSNCEFSKIVLFTISQFQISKFHNFKFRNFEIHNFEISNFKM